MLSRDEHIAVHTPIAQIWFLAPLADISSRYVRGCIPRRAMHASCDSPWHVLAQALRLGGLLLPHNAFQDTFLTMQDGRIAHVQGLRGCLYTLRCFHIPTYRFHGTVSACNSPKVTISLGQRWASGCLGMAGRWSSTWQNKAVIKSRVA